ncbi:AraC family transcriptional regulator [Ruminococcaceae bacterium OttesenSCG-928-L11]|nr:AraC family transcriptional regulator [Ruminococcaceae bacterium OttesenSCG-928-L11]
MANHFDEDIALTSVAEEIGLNSTYLSTMFKEESGMSFSQYLQKLRIERSKELLQSTSEPLSVIATQVGIGSEKSFIRLFKKLNHCTPGQYRSAMQKSEQKHP